MLYGSEMWRVKKGDILKFEYTELRMVRWMSNAMLRDRRGVLELR